MPLRRTGFLVFALALGGLLRPAAALALQITYEAPLSGAAEFPANASPGTGSATVVLDTTAHTLLVQVVFSGLTGTTTAAHIHCCVSPMASTPTVGVATLTPTFPGFPSAVTSGTYSHTLDLTDPASWNAPFLTANGDAAGAEAALAAGLDDGFAYLNIHTTAFPGGEIRGFLVPEPATALLLGAGLVAQAVAGRRRSA